MAQERCICASHPSGSHFVCFNRNGSGTVRQYDSIIFEVSTPSGFIPTCVYMSQSVDTPFFIIGGSNGRAGLFFYNSEKKVVESKNIFAISNSPILSCWTGRVAVSNTISDTPIYVCVLGHHSGKISFLISASLEEDLEFVEADVVYSNPQQNNTSPVRMISYSENQLVIIRHDKSMTIYNTNIEVTKRPIITLTSTNTIMGPGEFLSGTEVFGHNEPNKLSLNSRAIIVFWKGLINVYTGPNLRLTYTRPVILDKSDICSIAVSMGSNPEKSLIIGVGTHGGLHFESINLAKTSGDESFGKTQKLVDIACGFSSIPCGVCCINGRILVAPRIGKPTNIEISSITELRGML